MCMRFRAQKNPQMHTRFPLEKSRGFLFGTGAHAGPAAQRPAALAPILVIYYIILMNKIQFAFKCSVEELFRRYRRCYFWTFTLPHVESDWVAQRMWDRAKVTLCNFCGGTLKGIRVVEIHPGGHGLHWHCILNQRVDVRVLRSKLSALGFGRMRVKPCNKQTALYLSKYLTKQGKIYGIRRWGGIGGYDLTKVSDITIEDELHKKIKIVQLLTARKKINIRYIRYLIQGRTAEEVAELIYNEKNIKIKKEICKESMS